MKSTAEIRQAFLDYFTDRDHRLVKSASLVPANDPTLLFTNAGMVQFKDVFLGAEKRPYSRAASSQRCVRAGGKHNDLDQVGYTARHHTFFEMLGNFSFGDYFKREAIQYAWDLLTTVFELPAERLWVTVYQTDDEAYGIWKEVIGVDESRIVRIGDKAADKPYESDNFWAMGDTGPCGPCSEIFYDHGPDVAGGPPGSSDEDGDRYIEIWNLVFMQFDRSADGKLNPLPKPCVDTGMGLERIAAVLQGRHSNYDIDLFQHLIRSAGEATGYADLNSPSLKVIADHIRACAFLIADGVLPSNEGRGYVLRRIIRRAIRHGYKLGRKAAFFGGMVTPLAEVMGDAYPELQQKAEFIQSTLAGEEERFSRTLEAGMNILKTVISESQEGDGVIAGQQAFVLYDTYGFPLDLTEDVAREHNLTVDHRGFDEAMQEQQARARQAGQFKSQTQITADVLKDLPETVFAGYERLVCEDAVVAAILSEAGQRVERLEQGDSGILILDRTPFYAEAGGQVGDTGNIETEQADFRVRDTQKIAGVFYGHYGSVQRGTIEVGMPVSASVEAQRREAIVLHHSATHLLHAALRDVLGRHVEQKGSLVAPDRLRFDFSHPAALSEEQLEQIEQLVNRQIRRNAEADIKHMAYDDAITAGAMALFGEKYGDQVRVLRFDDFSVELCGGTHVGRAGDIGLFKITSEGGIAAGVRRIEALAGEAAVTWMEKIERQQKTLSAQLKAAPDQLQQKVQQLLEANRSLEKQLVQLKSQLASSAGEDLLGQAVEINGVTVLSAQLEGADAKGLRDTIDQLKSRVALLIVVLGVQDGEKVRLIAGVSQSLTDRIKAGDLVNHVAQQVGGRGGGRADLAQAGGTQPQHLSSALRSVSDWVTEKL